MRPCNTPNRAIGASPCPTGTLDRVFVIPSNRKTDEAPALRCPPLSRTWRTDPSDLSPANHPTKLRFAGTPGFQNSRAKSIRPGARFLPPAKTLERAKRRGAAVRPFRRFAGAAVSNLGALSSEHGKQIHLTGLRQIAPQSCALRGPRDFKTPGRSEFAREQGFCLRHKRLDAPKGAGPPCGPFGDLPGLYFKLEGALIQTWRTNPSGWFPANRRRHPHPLTARCGFWRPSGRRRTLPQWK